MAVPHRPASPGLAVVVGSLALSVQSGPSGENPTGPVSVHFGARSFADLRSGTATCLAVRGTRPWSVSPARSPALRFPPFAAALHVTDVASPDPFSDTFVFQELPLPGPTDCSSIPPPDPQLPTYNADIVVHDAQPPLPTSVKQCLHGGFAQFGFKNVGQCVTFVVLTRVCGILDRYGVKTKFCPPTPPGRL